MDAQGGDKPQTFSKDKKQKTTNHLKTEAGSPAGGGNLNLDTQLMQEHINAGVWKQAKSHNGIRDESRLRLTIRQRIENHGPTELDMADLSDYRTHLASQKNDQIQAEKMMQIEKQEAARKSQQAQFRQDALDQVIKAGKAERSRLIAVAASLPGAQRSSINEIKDQFVDTGELPKKKVTLALLQNAAVSLL